MYYKIEACFEEFDVLETHFRPSIFHLYEVRFKNTEMTGLNYEYLSKRENETVIA